MRSLTPVATAFALVAAIGCPSPAQTEQLRPSGGGSGGYTSPEAQQAYNDASDAFVHSRWAEAEEKYANFLAHFPFSSLVPDARYRRAVCLNRLGRYLEARQTLREFLDRYPTSEDVPKAAEELNYAEAMVAHTPPPPLPQVKALPPPVVAAAPPSAPVSGTTPAGHSASLDAIRQAIEAARSGDQAAQQRLGQLIDTQATFMDVNTLYAEGDERSPAWPLVVTKMARIYFHLGDIDRAAEAANRALKAGAAGHPERMQEILDVAALRRAVKPNTIGVILPLSGKLKPFGEAVQEGINLAIPKTDPLVLSVKDSQGEPDQAVAAVEALAKEGVIAIIGPVGSSEASPAALRAQQLGIPMLSLSRVENLTDIGPFIFRNSLTNSAQGKALARYARQVLNTKALGILAPDIPSGKEVTDAFWTTVQHEGGEIRAYETYAHDQTTFKSTLRRLIPHSGGLDRAEIERELAGEHNPFRRKKKKEKLLAAGGRPVVDFDALLIPDYYKSVLQIAPALKVEDVITDPCTHRSKLPPGAHPITLLGTAGWDSPELLARDARDVQCAVVVDGFFADSQREPTKAFVAAFNEQLKHAPGLLQAQGYDSARIIRDILLNQKPATRDAFRTALGNVHDFPGATGTTTFGPDREADKPLFFLTVDKSGFTELPVNISPAGIAAPAKAAE